MSLANKICLPQGVWYMGLTERLADANEIQQTIGTVPWYRWKALIEKGDLLIEGSGWGTVRDFDLVQT
jgi:hypothetical protein